MAMLEVRDLQVYYGMIHAIKGISFDVNQGEVIALIGANGAGKTTTLHTITGLLAPKSGSVLFEGKDITKVPAHKIVSMGMAHVPEGRRVFAELSVYENLKMGAYTRKDKKEIEESLANVYKRFPRLEERKNQMAGTLSGGEQQKAALAKVLLRQPAILLLDEPTNDLDVESLRALENAILEFPGCAMVISHDRWFLDRIATHILDYGDEGKVTFYEGNFSDYEEWKKKTLGEAATQPHRIKYKRIAK